MWKSRQPAVRQLEHTTFESAIHAARRLGFDVHTTRPDRVLLKRGGKTMTRSTEQLPLALALVARPEGGVELRLRYDTFVLVDTGDLEREADTIADAIRGTPAK